MTEALAEELRALLLKHHATNPNLDRWLAALSGDPS